MQECRCTVECLTLGDSLARRTWGSDSPLESVSLPSHPVAALIRGAGPDNKHERGTAANRCGFPNQDHPGHVYPKCHIYLLLVLELQQEYSFYERCPRVQKEVVAKREPLTSRKIAIAFFDEVLKSGCDFFELGCVLNCQKYGYHSHAGCSCNHARICRKDEIHDGEVAVSIQMEVQRHTCDHWIRKNRSVPT